ncbi:MULTISPECIES: DNA polymerase III subunit gamma/tau [unclassified Caballeronia]|uniref:DNA polymerase III subunit gamma/tau n=1 Tax=unclassified Caballeronia TaxID=2646786 RepID=UPI00285D1F3D|nr:MULTISPECIES: DNA polymerase III subunit gamma/tau [unclassified Caballeronia]MDR5750846.1 DNA polymerase III subunit gamma/tau [Caballeronia sp. LZ024]MDR5842121.1 DNA polymerase III subunit gamma/tau [Caballeronia sp. LZ031]
MTYQVLARKWRPKSFASLVGQEHVVRALTHALDGGRLHHAYLFTGTRGVGKTTLSRIFAKALNCETGVTSTPCGVCRACREIDEGRFVDYVEMDAASNRGVDEMAALLERAVYAPVDARFKVYMIDEVHMLTNHAFNAMLKTLEEPPSHVKFILATTDPQKIPVTVLSRCLQFNLKQMPAGHIVSHLENILGEEKIPFEAQALRLLSRAADGSMRDALSLTDQAIAYSANQVTEEAVRGMLGALDQSYLIRLLNALAAGDGEAVLSVADEMALRSLSFSTALQDLASLLHRIAWAQFAPASVLDEWPEAEDIRRFADALSAEQVQLFYQIATVGRSELGLAPDEYAGFTMTLLRMLAFEPAGGPGGGGGVAVNAPAGGSARKAGAVAATAANAASAQASRVNGAATVERAAPAASAQSGAMPVMPADAKRTAESAEPVASGLDAASTDSSATDASAEPQPSSRDEASPAAPVAPIAAAAQQAATASERDAEPPVDNSGRTAAPRAASGASAALDVLRSAGMRISSDRGARAAPATPKPVAAKPAAPAVPIPTPRRSSAAQPVESTPAAAPKRDAAASVPPWEDMPPDDYQPASAEDAYFMPPDDGFVPAFESGPDDLRFNATPAPAPKVDTRPLPPAVPLDAIGVKGDWPALAVDLPLKGISYQLAFNSELTACDATSIALSVPVPQYAEASQVAKLKTALADKLGRALEVSVTVGPARRTAAALDAALRAKRQQEAEQEIARDPFVQSLIRDFGASIVQGSIKPLASSGTAAGN